MDKEGKMFERIRIDLREFGWGIRDVPVIWPDEHEGGGSQPGPGSVGTREIADDSVEMEDLNHKVKDKMLTDDDRVTQGDLDGFDV